MFFSPTLGRKYPRWKKNPVKKNLSARFIGAIGPAKNFPLPLVWSRGTEVVRGGRQVNHLDVENRATRFLHGIIVPIYTIYRYTTYTHTHTYIYTKEAPKV